MARIIVMVLGLVGTVERFSEVQSQHRKRNDPTDQAAQAALQILRIVSRRRISTRFYINYGDRHRLRPSGPGSSRTCQRRGN